MPSDPLIGSLHSLRTPPIQNPGYAPALYRAYSSRQGWHRIKEYIEGDVEACNKLTHLNRKSPFNQKKAIFITF